MNITEGDIELAVREYDDLIAIADEHHDATTDRCEAVCRAIEIDHDAFHDFMRVTALAFVINKTSPVVWLLGASHIYGLAEYCFLLGILIGKEHSV